MRGAGGKGGGAGAGGASAACSPKQTGPALFCHVTLQASVVVLQWEELGWVPFSCSTQYWIHSNVQTCFFNGLN